MSTQNDRKLAAEKALQNMEWLVTHFNDDRKVPPKTPIDKREFVALLQSNFEKLDRDRSETISRSEIVAALSAITDFSANEYIMLQLLMRYFDFISELVDDNDEEEKAISRADVDVLSQFLLESSMSLDALYLWCSGPSGPPKADLIKPPPLSSEDTK